MIKGLGYLKYLKLSLIGFGISFFTVFAGNSVNASFPAIGMTSQLSDGNTCVINEDLSINCEKSNNAFTNSWNGGGAKSISSIFWSEDGIGILHNNQISGYDMQGLVVDGFHICSGNTLSNIQGNGDFFATCPGGFETIGNYTYNQLIEKLQSKTPLYRWNSTQYAGTFLAIIYDDFYFGIGIGGYGSSQLHLNGNFVSQDLGFSNSLTYSGINWNNVNILNKPNGNSSSSFNPGTTGSITQYCTYGAVFDYWEHLGMTKYLCYGGLDNFDLYSSQAVYNNLIPGTGKTLKQIYQYSSGTWDSPQEWFNFWNGLYDDSNSVAMWESYPAVFHTWFDIYHRYNGTDFTFESIYNYCNYSLSPNVDRNQIIYGGGTFGKACNYMKDNNLLTSTGSYNGEGGYTDNDISVNWGSGTDVDSANGWLQKFFDKTNSSLSDNYSGGFGFIPGYIIVFLLGLILFRFLSH